MKESIIQKMREEGLKLTPQRLAVIEVLIEKRLLHPSADLICREARKKVKSLSLSTIYSILNEFSNHGIIKMLEFDKMENRYEANAREHINLFRIDTNDVAKKRMGLSRRKSYEKEVWKNVQDNKVLRIGNFRSFINHCLDFHLCPNSLQGRIELLPRRDQGEF